jgi:hypothetical protein
MADNKAIYGFDKIADVISNKVLSIGERAVLTAIEEASAEQTRFMNAVNSTLVEPVTVGKDLIEQIASTEMQPLDEFGNPLPIKGLPAISVGYPIFDRGTAWASNRKTRAKMTGMDAQKRTIEAFIASTNTNTRHMLAALLDNVSWTFNDVDLKLGNITVFPLANNDTQTYLKAGGTQAVDNHYLSQAAAISDAANPFPTIYTELTEHPGNGDLVVVYVSSSLVSTIQALSDWTPAPTMGINQAITGATFAAGLDIEAIRGPGDLVLGHTDRCFVVEWRALPDGYMIGHAAQSGPVLAKREHPEPALQGLFVENNSPDGNIVETRMIEMNGYGVMNRIGALAYFVGNAAYQIPTGYDAPLAM